MKPKVIDRFKNLLLLVMSALLILGGGSSVLAETISVAPDEAYQGYTNELWINTKPEQSGITYKTNIPSSRVKIYEKDKNAKIGWYKGNSYFYSKGTGEYAGKEVDATTDGYQKAMYNSYMAGYAGVGFDISSLESSDYIQTNHAKIGKYKNKWIDAQVTYSNLKHKDTWNILSRGIEKEHTYLDINENLTNGYVYSNLSSLDISITFKERDSGKIIDFSDDANAHSFLTFGSLNSVYLKTDKINPDDFVKESTSTYSLLASEFAIYNNATGKDLKAYISNDSNLQFSKVPITGFPDSVYNGRSSKDYEDEIGSTTFKKNAVSFELTGTTQKFTVGAGRSVAWNNYSGATIFMNTPQEGEEPSKKVLNESGKEINTQEVKKGQIVDWEVSVPVGNMGVTLLEKYNELKVIDPLPSQVDFQSYKVLDSKGNDITGDTTIAMSGQTATVNFSKDYLLNKMLYEGETYKVVFRTKVKTSLPVGYNKIENSADVYYNKMSIPTNKPWVFEKETIKNNVEKKINGGKSANVKIGEDYTYTVDFLVGNEEDDLTSLSLIDDLEDVQTVTKAVVKDKDGKDISSLGTLSIDSKTAKVEWKAKSPKDFVGQKISMEITAKLNDVPELANYIENGVIKVPNTAKMVTNSKETPSDKTTITPPPVESKAEKFIVLNK